MIDLPAGIVSGQMRGQRVLVTGEDERYRVDEGAVEIEENGVNAGQHRSSIYRAARAGHGRGGGRL